MREGSQLTLRDYFAGQALAGLFSTKRSGEPELYYNATADRGRSAPDNRAWIPESHSERWAQNAYRIADSMLAARSRCKGEDFVLPPETD